MKRFVDTDVWHKEWFRKLAPQEKCAWAYLTATCDNVGVLRVDRGLADYQIGAPVDWDGLVEKVNGNLIVLPNGKFWLVDFCEFQYGELCESVRPHASYIAMLRKHGLLHLFRRTDKGYGYPINRVQDKIRLGLGSDKDKTRQEEDRVTEPFKELKEKFKRSPRVPGGSRTKGGTSDRGLRT